MKRTIDLKHVGPKDHVRHLIEDLSEHLEEKLRHFPREAVSLHVVFEENGTHTLYRASVTCHVPGHMLATHHESHDSGSAIREAFDELERRVEKETTALRRRRHLRRDIDQTFQPEATGS